MSIRMCLGRLLPQLNPALCPVAVVADWLPDNGVRRSHIDCDYLRSVPIESWKGLVRLSLSCRWAVGY